MILLDQLGRTLTFSKKPEKIVSLVPSITETLVDVGLEDSLVGITKFCVHPSYLKSKIKIIGGTKNPRVQDIIDLSPDLVLVNKEENRLEDIEVLEAYCSVYVSDIKTIQDTIVFIDDMTTIFETIKTDQLLKELEVLNNLAISTKLKACYLIWKKPWMTVGRDTFIHHMMQKFGYENIFSHGTRYPEISIDDIKGQHPDVIFLSSEPYPFKASDAQELSEIMKVKIILVDGEIFSWYGTRLLRAKSYFMELEQKIFSLQNKRLRFRSVDI